MLAVALVLGLGLGLYVWVNSVLAEPSMAALLAVGVMALVGIVLVLNHRLQLAQVQRDRALAQASAMQCTMCEGQQNRDHGLEQCSTQRMQALQNEIAYLRERDRLLQVQAHHDGLTGLANRILLADRFRFAVERSKRSRKPFALLMIDLNGFKAINDNYGHVAGDAVLVTTARRLVDAVRASDTVARLGGDEFVLIIESIEDLKELNQIGQKLIDTLSDPIVLENGVVVNSGASVGLAVYPEDGNDMNDLLNIADQAMYECKSTGAMGLH